MKELVVIAHVPTVAVDLGFIPAAHRLGLSVTLLTDCAPAYRQQLASAAPEQRPDQLLACDVFNPLAIIEVLTRRGTMPGAIFSNSDHLQTATSLAAQYFGLPGKDWRTTYRAKNKAEMRAHLAALGIDSLWHRVVCDADQLDALLAEDNPPWPCIVKPREGVASEMVTLVDGAAAMREKCAAIWAGNSAQVLLLEQYLPGELYSLETLGDKDNILALGGFHTRLSDPPHFIELDTVWGTGLPVAVEQQVLAILRRFGVGFGACHTEFVMGPSGPCLIEINYRSIGDWCEFQLAHALQIPLFEIVLQLYLGQPLPDLKLAPNCAWVRYFTAQQAGVLQAASEAFSLEQPGLSLQYQPLRKTGDTIRLTHSNRDYLGVLRGIAPNREQLAAAMAQTTTQLNWSIA